MAARRSLKSDPTRLEIQVVGDIGTADTLASDSTPQEDPVPATQVASSTDPRGLLARATGGPLWEGPSHLDLSDAGDTMEQKQHQTEIADHYNSTGTPAKSLSIEKVGTPNLRETTSSGEQQTTSSAYPIPISPITPQLSPVEKPGASSLSPAGSLGLEKSDTNATISMEGSAETLEPKIDCTDNLVSKTTLDLPTQDTVTPTRSSPRKSRQPKQHLDVFSPSDSPQIGTSLLRRESLRKRECSSKKAESRKSRSPKKRDTLSRRDTLQEREILQKVIAETNQAPRGENSESNMDTVKTVTESKPETEPRIINQMGKTARSELLTSPGTVPNDAIPSAEVLAQTCTDSAETDLTQAMEATKVFERPVFSQANEGSPDNSVDKIEDSKAIDKADECIVTTESDEAARTAEATHPELESASRKTRSTARFSDDTSMLRDFLNRAQASKAAKTPVLLPLDAPKPQISPRRSPRKTPGSHKGTASMLQQSKHIVNRSGTPPRTAQSAGLESDDAEEITATPTSCRRSTRTRLPAPSKTPPGAPSFIPVRRADGSDPVILQKSQAQELATTTRANTRRNKGQSKPPLLALKELPADSSEVIIARQRAESTKAVGWAANLASYQDSKEGMSDMEEAKPRIRRMRGLGAANGTPAPKKSAAVVNNSNGTPAPKRRGKAVSGK